jgi:hypothetical protein
LLVGFMTKNFYEPCKISWKKKNLHIQILAITLKNHEKKKKKKKVKKNEKPRFYRQNKLLS